MSYVNFFCRTFLRYQQPLKNKKTSLKVARCCNGFFLMMLLSLTSCFSKKDKDYLIIQNKGSDTLVNLAQVWAEAYRQVRPNVAIAVSGGGSGTGIAALINNQVDIANSSRRMKPEEIESAKKNSGKDVQEYVVALDALSVFVHPNNPLKGLSKKEIACIYGSEGTCEYWHDIRGTIVPGCKNNKIIRVSRQSNSGTYQYFLESVIGKNKDMKLGSMDLNGSKESIDFVEQTPCAIGYTGMGYIHPGIKALCVAENDQSDCIDPNLENALTRKYPIARELFFYILGTPSEEVKRYLDWIKTIEATKLVVKMGYVPSPAFWTMDELEKIIAK